MPYRTHLTVLEDSAAIYPDRPVFRIPKTGGDDSEVEDWQVVTYSQFNSGVTLYARHWARILNADGLPPRSVVGLWLSGLSYIDVLHIYGVARAGYIPQLFSLRLPNPDVIFELLTRANASALIYDPAFEAVLAAAPVPIHAATEVLEADAELTELPALSATRRAEDIVMIFHTSGSTSGSPKLVRCSYKWLDAMISKAYVAGRPKTTLRQDVTVWMGSMSHIGQTFMLLGSLQHGSCTIQPTKIPFSSRELTEMVTRCRLNRLNQFATFLVTHLRASRTDAKLLATLQGLDEVLYSGLALPQEDAAYASQNNIPLKNLFGSTECGAMLLSVGGNGPDANLLRPIEGTSYGFFPTAPGPQSGVHQNANVQLKELVILSGSSDCPDPLLRSTDGHFHTGDLFIEPMPGLYVSRGRDDDWIKSQTSLRCDTKAIEDNVRATCGDLVSDCIVVGNGRPSPALFVEPKGEISEERLKKDIIRRTRHFHSRRYVHERITSTKFVFVVPKGTLPRTATKGNIRRKAVEEAYKDMLDDVYGMSF